MDNETIILDMELDTNNAKTELTEMQIALAEIAKNVAGIGNVIFAAFTLAAKGIARAENSINSMTGAIQLAVKERETLISLQNQKTDGGWTEGLSVASDIGSVIQTLIALTDDLVVAKLASKAEDIAIIALYAADYVAAFGKQVAGLATSTAAWIADTAAKVGNTAAQWAQIAATTAWQGICAAATAVTTAFGAAMTFLTSPIGLVVIGITALIAIIALLIANWDTVSAKTQEVWGFIQGLFAQFDDFLQNIFAKDFTEQFGELGSFMNAFCKNIENVWNAVKSIFGGIIDFVKNVFAGNWGAALEGLISIFKGVFDMIGAVIKAPFNLIIGFMNSIIQSAVDRINIIINMLNGLSFDIPDWVPVFGGKKFGFNLEPIKAPQFPLLAKGAVLPANRPFLAMVGDQHHGTNIEAPLATIQEAVALVMEDLAAQNAEGQRATVEMLRNILEAVLGIQIGDDVIGRAASRYNRKMAIARGGY